MWLLLVLGGCFRLHLISQTPVDEHYKAQPAALMRSPPPPRPPPLRAPPPYWTIEPTPREPPLYVWVRCAGNGKYLSVSQRTKVRAAASDATHPRAHWEVLDVVGQDGRAGVALRSRLTRQLVGLPRFGDDPQLRGGNDTRTQLGAELAWRLPSLDGPGDEPLERRLMTLPQKNGTALGCLHYDPEQPSPALDLTVERPCPQLPADAAASLLTRAAAANAPSAERAATGFRVGRVEAAAAADAHAAEQAQLRALGGKVVVALGVAVRTRARTPPEELPLVRFLAPSVARTAAPHSLHDGDGGAGGGGKVVISYVLMIGRGGMVLKVAVFLAVCSGKGHHHGLS